MQQLVDWNLVGGARRDHQHFVSGASQVLEHLQHRIDDAVHLRKEGLCDYHDLHALSVTPDGDDGRQFHEAFSS